MVLVVGPWKRPFIHDWAAAAAAHGRVVGLELGESATAWPLHASGSTFPGFSLEVGSLRPGRLLAPVNARLRQRALHELIQQVEEETGRVRVVHTHFASAADAVVALDRSFRWVHTEHSSRILTGTLSAGAARRASAVFEGADELTFVGPALRHAAERLTAAAARGHIVPNPVTVAPRTRPRASAAAGPPVFVAVGKLIELKRHHLLVDALATLRETVPGARLQVVGEGPARERIIGRAEELGVAEAVELLGERPRSEVFEIVEAADALLHPSEHETYGVVMAEALLLGTPVIATACGGLTADPPTPDLVVVSTPDELAAAMIEVMSSRRDPDAVAAAAGRAIGIHRITDLLGELYSGAQA